MKTMLITGVRTGLGRAFAVAALAAGHSVVGTVRKPQDAKVFEETPLSQWRGQFASNVFGVAATLQASLPFMRVGRAGHLMAVTSMGLKAVPGMSAYCASKVAVEGMLESPRKEISGFGVRVTAVEPGSFPYRLGSMTRAANVTSSLADAATEGLGAKGPLRRLCVRHRSDHQATPAIFPQCRELLPR